VSQSSLYNRIESREHIIELLRATIFAGKTVLQVALKQFGSFSC
jgi:hypothetical protein